MCAPGNQRSGRKLIFQRASSSLPPLLPATPIRQEWVTMGAEEEEEEEAAASSHKKQHAISNYTRSRHPTPPTTTSE